MSGLLNAESCIFYLVSCILHLVSRISLKVIVILLPTILTCAVHPCITVQHRQRGDLDTLRFTKTIFSYMAKSSDRRKFIKHLGVGSLAAGITPAQLFEDAGE